ncbi:hypothetical protein OVA26_13600 [Microbacterium sp. SL62]|uniref:hypothetical protein n=1 Tax=Microbacterium sp. SL62 TaxID=2995139 RepID=UPI0022752308|nr:hypothetical protein [Microbacterium sp. SL62]MCY1717973.1 hypothetical protein [Microbacterium sp. SL62]
MSDAEFDQRLERVRKAADVIGSLPTKTLQADAFHYLIGQPVSHRTRVEPEPRAQSQSAPSDDAAAQTADPPAAPANGKKSTPRKPKAPGVNPDKALELSPQGKQSFADFVAEKKPSTHIEKYTVCVYWMLVIAENTKATIAQIVTCYHAEKWTLPTDVKNTASQAGKKELDNSGGLEDIKLSNLGRNLVLGLPKAEAKK